MKPRKLDEMGRIVIPVKIRKLLNFTEDTLLEIEAKKGQVIIKRSVNCCAICNGSKDILEEFGICRSCAEKIAAHINSEK